MQLVAWFILVAWKLEVFISLNVCQVRSQKIQKLLNLLNLVVLTYVYNVQHWCETFFSFTCRRWKTWCAICRFYRTRAFVCEVNNYVNWRAGFIQDQCQILEIIMLLFLMYFKIIYIFRRWPTMFVKHSHFFPGFSHSFGVCHLTTVLHIFHFQRM